MKQSKSSSSTVTGRRAFLRAAGLATAATAALPALALAEPNGRWWGRKKVSLTALGMFGFDITPLALKPFSLPPTDVCLDLAALMAPVIARVEAAGKSFLMPTVWNQTTFPVGRRKDLLVARFFIVDGAAADPFADTVDLSVVEMTVSHILLGTAPVMVNPMANPPEVRQLPTFTFIGPVLRNPVESPYGDLTGAVFTVSGGWDPVAETIHLLTLGISGSHYSMIGPMQPLQGQFTLR